MSGSRSITLALGGGGVKCYAHLGVLKAVVAAGWKIEGIAGTSAAALIAALFARGDSPDEIAARFQRLDFRKLSRRSLEDRQALFGLSRWRRFVYDLLGELRFEDLSVPIAFPIVDLATRQESSLRTGRVADAVIAAAAIPGIFPPQLVNGRTYIDGGVLNPIPAALARSLSPQAICGAVALMPPIDEWSGHPFPQLLDSVPMFRFLARLRYTQALAVYVQASDLTNRRLAEMRLENESPELIIRPDVNQLGLFDDIDIAAVIRAGETAADKALEEFVNA